jgi:hypothetical protein
VEEDEIPPTINVTSGSIEYSVTVCPSVYSPGYWEIDCPRTKGFVGRLFGKSEEGELGSVVNAIAEILRDEEAITRIKWYRDYSERVDEYARAHSVKYIRKVAPFLEKLIPCLCLLGSVLCVVDFAIDRRKSWLCNIGATIFMAGFCSFFLFTGMSYSYQSILRIRETFHRGGKKKLVQWLFFLSVLAIGVCFFAFALMILLVVFPGIWK